LITYLCSSFFFDFGHFSQQKRHLFFTTTDFI
jgi:hypothetical protein